MHLIHAGEINSNSNKQQQYAQVEWKREGEGEASMKGSSSCVRVHWSMQC